MIKKLHKFYVIALCSMCLIPGCDKQADFEGLYTFGENINTVQLCNHHELYWVKAESDLLNELQDSYNELSDNKYHPIYIRFNGQQIDVELEGAAKKFDGYFEINEIIQVNSLKIDQCGYTSQKL